MDLMCVILEWDWRPSDMPAAAAQRMVADAAQVRPATGHDTPVSVPFTIGLWPLLH